MCRVRRPSSTTRRLLYTAVFTSSLRAAALRPATLRPATMAAEWDAAAGVYKNNRAAGASCEVPKPLWIFGYGSLVWRPEARWEAYERRPCVVRGWRRYFAQLSTDHRGVPGAPGLVCTLLEEAGATTQGVAYRVPDAEVDAVLDDLDFREKGGYTRKVARVDFDDSAVDALVYSATRENPNFVAGLDADSEEAIDRASAIIATAVGPSGDNAAYLFNLADVLPDDAYLAALKARVVALRASKM